MRRMMQLMQPDEDRSGGMMRWWNEHSGSSEDS